MLTDSISLFADTALCPLCLQQGQTQPTVAGAHFVHALFQVEDTVTGFPNKDMQLILLQGYTIRIAFNIIQGNDGQEHCEVTGRMPQLNSNLQAALEEGAPVKDLLAEARTALQVLAQFCSELATV